MKKIKFFKRAVNTLFALMFICNFLSAELHDYASDLLLPEAVMSKMHTSSECERGKRGRHGRRGHRGHRGHHGHNGGQGAQGPEGPQGAPGELIEAYISSYIDGLSRTFADDSVGPYSFVVGFDTEQEPPVGITRTGTFLGSTFTIADTGIYYVSWNLSIENFTTGIFPPELEFVLFNATTATDFAPSTKYTISLLSDDGEKMVSGQMIIPITTAGTDIELHGALINASVLGGFLNNPSISITKIAD